MKLAFGNRKAADKVARAESNRLFGRYKPEERHEVRGLDVKEDRILMQLRKAWKRFDFESGAEIEENYNRAVSLVKDIKCSAKDVENFSILLGEFASEWAFSFKAGHFLSALINNGKDNDYLLHVRHLSGDIDVLGFQNTKNITIEGDVNSWLGMRMSTGSIIVKGNAGTWVGEQMRGGKIMIEGNARDGFGNRMENGEIHLNGRFVLGEHNQIRASRRVCISIDIKGGRIYHRGILIVDKGGVIE